MKVFACYSDSHIVFLERHFLPSLPTSTSVELVHMEQVCPSGVYTDPLWGSMAGEMLAHKASAIRISHVPLFVSDVDARFYDHINIDLGTALEDTGADMLMQDDGAGGLCSGSFAAMPGPKVAAVLSDAIKLLPKHNGHDQPALNEALANHPEVKVKKLSRRYWGHGPDTGKMWEPGMVVDPPKDIILHQANWCIGIENKLALLDQVKRTVESRRCGETTMTIEDAKEWMRRNGNPDECIRTLVGCEAPNMFFFRDSLGAVISVMYDVKDKSWISARVP